MTYDYHSQCLTCNLSENLRNFVDSWQNTYAGLSRELFATHNIAISADALSNHKRFHADQKTVTPQEDDLAEPDDNGIVVKDGVKYVKRLKKEWQLHNGEIRRTYEYIPVEDASQEKLEFPVLLEYLQKDNKPDFQPLIQKNRTVVTQFADLQVGKVGSRGDSNSMIQRVVEFREKMEDYIADSGAQKAVFADLGDIVESFENTAQQGFTNDLSLMDQISLASLIEQDLIATQARYVDHVDVTGVPSNHGAWRKGKDYLGKPQDDWGIFILKQIENAFSYSDSLKDSVTFHYPKAWDKTISLRVGPEVIGFAHGDDCSQDKTPDWWAKQVHGGGPLHNATMLLTGHYHNLRIQNSGRTPDGKMKWWLSGNSMDNGSDWWRHKNGSDTSPGVTMFLIDDEKGFDLGSLVVL